MFHVTYLMCSELVTNTARGKSIKKKDKWPICLQRMIIKTPSCNTALRSNIPLDHEIKNTRNVKI